MKKVIKVLVIIFWSIVSYAQCDSVEFVLEGDFITNSVRNPIVKIDKGLTNPVIGQEVKISKYFETKLFGFMTSGYMSIANAKISKISGQNITFNIIEETSDVTINGKKKNQFAKGNHVKIEWKEKPQIKTRLKMENGDTTIYGQMLCGKRIGEWRWYYDNNKIKATEYYVNGELNGPVRGYYKNGVLKKEVNYVEGKKEGKYTGYYENGNMEYVENYKDGKIDGAVTDYYKNGKIKSIVFSDDNGKLDGEIKYYYKNGNLRYERMYKHGEKTGYYKGYHPNGKPFIISQTVKDKLDGDYKDYFDNGTLKFDGAYVMGKRIGFWKEYYENGQLHIHGEMKNGNKVGYWESFYENGEPKSNGNYDNEGNKIGKWFNWDENGKKTKTKYKKD